MRTESRNLVANELSPAVTHPFLTFELQGVGPPQDTWLKIGTGHPSNSKVGHATQVPSFVPFPLQGHVHHSHPSLSLPVCSVMLNTAALIPDPRITSQKEKRTGGQLPHTEDKDRQRSFINKVKPATKTQASFKLLSPFLQSPLEGPLSPTLEFDDGSHL